jgi:dolichol-phosphate mannosyltransferase
VYYDRQDRVGGEGKLSFISRIKYAMDAITSFSYKPLRLSFVLAGIGVFIAAVMGVLALLSDTNAMGYGLFAVIFFMTSLPLFCVGILGEYLGRVYDEVRERPLSIINRVYRTDQIFTTQQLGSEKMTTAMHDTVLDKLFPAA